MNKEIASKSKRIKLVENIVTNSLRQNKDTKTCYYNTAYASIKDFTRISCFYQCNYSTILDCALKVGERIQIIELDYNTLIPTGRKCFRFIKSMTALPTLLLDETYYDIELSVLRTT